MGSTVRAPALLLPALALIFAGATIGLRLDAQTSPERPPGRAPDGDATRLQLDELLAEFAVAQEAYFHAALASGDASAAERTLDPSENPVPHFLPRFTRFARSHAATEEAIVAWMWVVEHAGRTPRVTAAATEAIEVLLAEYRDHPALGAALRFAHDLGPRPAIRHLLETLWTASSVAATRAAAGTELARLLLDGENPTPLDPSTGEPGSSGEADDRARAREILSTVRDELGAVEFHRSLTYGEVVAADLFELENLALGCTAPEITGETSDGTPMRLSDHRGRVVLLVFRGEWCRTCREDVTALRALADRHAADPFTIVGVETAIDVGATDRTPVTERFPGPRWADGAGRGPIATRWNIRRWPTTFLIDATGVIRGRDLSEEALEEAIAAALAAARGPGAVSPPNDR